LSISIEPCAKVNADEVERLAAIELAHAPQDVAIVAHVGCEKGLIALTVDDPVTRKTLGRKLDLASTPPRGRARTLALALAELIEASWSELLLPPPRVAAAGPAPTRAQEQAVSAGIVERERERAFRVALVGSGQRFTAGALWEWGGGARLAWVPGTFGVTADFRVGHGVNASSLGQLSVDTFGGSLAALAHAALGGVFGLDGGLGLRGGSATVLGKPADAASATGTSLTGPWLAPMAFLEAGLFTRLVLVQLGVEGGLTVLGVRGRVNGAGGTGIYGPYFQLSASVGLRL
jgi:hypothetical protein